MVIGHGQWSSKSVFKKCRIHSRIKMMINFLLWLEYIFAYYKIPYTLINIFKYVIKRSYNKEEHKTKLIKPLIFQLWIEFNI